MDFKLQLLKVYLDNKIAEQEDQTGVPIGDSVVEFKMLCNSDPGIISVFVGRTQPAANKGTNVDVWYDFSTFREKSADLWIEFTTFKSQFTSTILDLDDASLIVDIPVALDIVGPATVDKDTASSAQYQCFVVLTSGNVYPLQDAIWSVQTPDSSITISRETNSGDGILDFSFLTNSVNCVIRAEFSLADGTLVTKEYSVRINVAGIQPLITYSLSITGPASVNSQGTASYLSSLRTDYSDGTFNVQNVTTNSLWSVSTATGGAIASGGLFTAAKVSADVNLNVMASHVVGGVVVTATYPIVVTIRVIQTVEITGPASVKELKTAQYGIKITYTNGDTENDTLPVTWSLQNSVAGTINTNGLFTAPSVNADDNTQVIKADVLYEGSVFRADKPITIVDVLAPELSVQGSSLINAGGTAIFTANILFENQTYSVNPVWSIIPSSAGTIDPVTGEFVARNVTIDMTFEVHGTITYQGYTVTNFKTVTIKAIAVTPSSLVIDGLSQVVEGNQATYVATATMSDGTQKIVNPVWTTNSTSHTITSAGVLTSGLVNFDTVCQVRASYTENSVTAVATLDVLIKDDPEIWQPKTLAIVGPASVDEGSTTKYTANVTEESNKGNSRTITNVTVQWMVSNYGSVTTDGNFTAAQVNANATAIVSAVYDDGINLPVSSSLNVTVVNIPLLVSLALSLDAVSVFGGFPTKIHAVITRTSGTEDVTSAPGITYTSSDANVSINKTSGDVTTQTTVTTKNITITATYLENGETKTAQVTLEVKANLADTLTITPSSSTVFENAVVNFNASLTMVDGTFSTITPTWVLSNPALGSISAAGVFTTASVAANSIANIHATYSGVETGGATKTSNTATVNITNIVAQSLSIYNDAGIYTVNELETVIIKPKVTYNNSFIDYPKTLTYSLSATDQNYATLTYDSTTGNCSILCKDLVADRIVTVNATGSFGLAGDPGVTLSATRQINLKYVRSVVSLELTMSSGPYFEFKSASFTLRQKFDDNTYGPAITSGMTWSDVSAIATISGLNITFKAVTASTPFSITATYGGLTSNAVTGNILDYEPIGLTLSSSAGNTIKRYTNGLAPRNDQTVLTASISMSDGTSTNPSSQNPVTWQLMDSSAGTIVSNADYTATLTGAALLTDKTFDVKATAGTATATISLMVDGFAIPTSATLNGPATVESGSTTDYTLTVTMSDTSNRTINASQATYSAVFGETFAVGGSVSNVGRFVAPTTATAVDGTITATYTDSVSGIPVTATALPVHVNAAIVLAPTLVEFVSPASTVPSAGTTAFTIRVTMNDNSTRVVSPSQTTYAAQTTWSTTVAGGTISGGTFTAPTTNTGTTGTVTASYTLNGTTKSVSTPVTISAAIANSMTVTPSTISIFEGVTQQLTATLNTGKVVIPTYAVTNTALGSINASGLLSTLAVAADTATTITASYNGAETNNLPVNATAVALTVKDIAPATVDVYNATASYSVNEGAIVTLSSKVTFNDTSIVDPATTVNYAITTGAAYASLTQSNGVATITGGTVTANQTVVVTATYTAPDDKQKTGTRTLTITNSVKAVTGLVVDSVQATPYYEGSTVTLRVREQFDDGSFSTNVTTGITWAVSNASYATVTGVAATLGTVTGDQAITITGTYNGRTSNAFALTVIDIVPATVTLVSSTGSFTVKRGASATFTANITMNNGGAPVAANASYPVTWANNNAGAGTFAAAGYGYSFTAAASNTDLTFNITATTANSKVGTSAVTLDGYPIPTGAVISGAATVAAGATTDYLLTVTMSDNTTRLCSATNTTYAAAWTENLTNGTIVAGTGRFTAGSPTVAEGGNINASYTDSVSGVTVPATAYPITVSAITTTTPAPAGGWEDAVYYGTIDTRCANTAAAYTTWLTTADPNNSGNNYLIKGASATNLLASQQITLNRDATVYDKAVILYPKKYGYAAARIDSTAAMGTGGATLPGYFNGTATVEDLTMISHAGIGDYGTNSPMTVSLSVGGSPMDFYVYRGKATLTSGAAGTVQFVRVTAP